MHASGQGGYYGNTVGLYHDWTRAEFEVARQCGSTPIAYCSGWDDPVACKAQAAAWNVLLCLDNEGGIRPDGAWAQPWLDASGAGVYGNAPVHRLRAAFHVLAAYPSSGDPGGASWNYTARPAGPCGWQWAGTHTEFGIGVDSTWFDDWFAGGTFGAGAGSITLELRRAYAVASTTSLHQFCRGTDPAGHRALFHRRRNKGTWSPWALLGAGTGVLGDSVISGGFDEQGTLVITVDGTDGDFYDIESKDDGVTWSAFTGPHGGGDGLLTIGAMAPGGTVDLSQVTQGIGDIRSDIAAIKFPTSLTGKLA
jgi:hypothetical protein